MEVVNSEDNGLRSYIGYNGSYIGYISYNGSYICYICYKGSYICYIEVTKGVMEELRMKYIDR